MFKFTSIVFAFIACVCSSVSAGFLSTAPAVYSAGVTPSAYVSAPVTKYAAAYAAGPALTHTYATTSYAASPYFRVNPWSGYRVRSLGGYIAPPAHFTKFVAPPVAYPATYAAPAGTYQATYSAPATYVSYAAPAHAGYAQTGYAHSTYSQLAYGSGSFSPYTAAGPDTLAAW